eukprot:CAMPEP_0198198064 /NCGR_PEP_ID=MMETSP1445-20131203/1574_1 /TAXON_ID=36898 /ORGANISM="Pyramimonas sp., Strain CCMP2087" /LENGTH=133 /DNA_ID=CAMNT_0043867509 /DNA_START=299 /DNA_END=700 /DNA_ORIENTATION=-
MNTKRAVLARDASKVVNALSKEEMAAKLRELDGDLGILLEPDREEVVQERRNKARKDLDGYRIAPGDRSSGQSGDQPKKIMPQLDPNMEFPEITTEFLQGSALALFAFTVLFNVFYLVVVDSTFFKFIPTNYE